MAKTQLEKWILEASQSTVRQIQGSIHDIKKHLDRADAYAKAAPSNDEDAEERMLAIKASLTAFCKAADIFGKVLDKDYEPQSSILMRAFFGNPEDREPTEPECDA